MSYASLTLTIVFVVNLLFFLMGTTEVNSPMLGLLKGIISGNYEFDFSSIFNVRNLVIVSSLIVVTGVISAIMSPGSVLSGNFSTIHVLTIIAIGVFASFLAVPNFSAFGIPEPLGTIINVFFGFLVIMSVFGLLRGE